MQSSEFISRVKVWRYLAGVNALRVAHRKFNYKTERARANKNTGQIDKDLKRTLIPSVGDPHVREQYYCSLRHVLTAYTNFSPSVGYVQGMNIIASCLLYNICDGDYANIEAFEQLAFWLLAALLESFGIRECFCKDMRKVFDLSNELESLLRQNVPEVLCFINSGDVC